MDRNLVWTWFLQAWVIWMINEGFDSIVLLQGCHITDNWDDQFRTEDLCVTGTSAEIWGISSILFGLGFVPWYDILFYHQSVIMLWWDMRLLRGHWCNLFQYELDPLYQSSFNFHYTLYLATIFTHYSLTKTILSALQTSMKTILYWYK